MSERRRQRRRRRPLGLLAGDNPGRPAARDDSRDERRQQVPRRDAAGEDGDDGPAQRVEDELNTEQVRERVLALVALRDEEYPASILHRGWNGDGLFVPIPDTRLYQPSGENRLFALPGEREFVVFAARTFDSIVLWSRNWDQNPPPPAQLQTIVEPQYSVLPAKFYTWKDSMRYCHGGRAGAYTQLQVVVQVGYDSVPIWQPWSEDAAELQQLHSQDYVFMHFVDAIYDSARAGGDNERAVAVLDIKTRIVRAMEYYYRHPEQYARALARHRDERTRSYARISQLVRDSGSRAIQRAWATRLARERLLFAEDPRALRGRR